MIIDSHVHVFPPEIIKERERISQIDPGFSILYRKNTSKMASYEDVLSYLDSSGIDLCFCLGFPFREKSLLKLSNDYILSLSEMKRVIPFVSLDFYDPEWSIEELDRCFRLGAIGVGEVSFYDRSMGKEEFERIKPIANIIRERAGILILHINEQIGHRYDGKISIDFRALFEFIEEMEGLRIVLSHLGGGICFYEFMPEVRRSFSNVYYDLAAVPFLYDISISGFIERFIPEKVIFGSDFPLLSFNRYSEILAPMSQEKRERILYLNAKNLLQKV